MAATNRIASPVIIAQTGLEMLRTIDGMPDNSPLANAIAKAMEQLISGAPFTRQGTAITFQSRSRKDRGIEHHTDQYGCTCEAAQQGMRCWHRAARRIILAITDADQPASQPTAREYRPLYCRYCGHAMRSTTTPAAEPCYQCTNQRCQWTVMAAGYRPDHAPDLPHRAA